MPGLDVTVSQFSGTYLNLNGGCTISASKEKCIYAAATVGTPLLRKGVASGNHAITMAVYKALAVKATMDFTQKRLVGFKAFRQLDPTEKGNLSFWIGMTFTSLVARELLGIEQLLHASCFNPRRIVKKKGMGKSLADLVGRDGSAAWHVLEAKGVQRKPDTKQREKWKAQAETISTIGGKAPATKSYCVAKVGPVYSAELVDPDGDGKGIDIDFVQATEDAALIAVYYKPLLETLAQSPTKIVRQNNSFTITRVGFDVVEQRFVFIGLEDRMLGGLLKGEVIKENRESDGADYYLGRDGIVIVTSSTCKP